MSFTQVLTARPDGSYPIYLGELGNVSDLVHSNTLPGGDEALSCILHSDIDRHEAFGNGRIVQAYRGGQVWEGMLEEPTPGQGTWSITASGLGVAGSYYRDVYSSWTASDVITSAAARGLRWKVGTVTGGFLTEKTDSAAQSVTDFMNAYTSPSSKTWQVARDRYVNVFSMPTVATRLLVCTTPQARAMAGYKNALYVRYQISTDNTDTNTVATYGLTVATLPDSIAKHGRFEDFWDLSGAGVMSGATALALGNAALAKYQAASYAGPFVVSYGQYLNMGGAPTDLGVEQSGEVARLMLMDGPYGGEVSPAPPVEFVVGRVLYNDMANTLEITPRQSKGNDWASILEELTPKAPV